MINISSILCYQFLGFKQDTRNAKHRRLVCSSHRTFKNQLSFCLLSDVKYYTCYFPICFLKLSACNMRGRTAVIAYFLLGQGPMKRGLHRG